MGSPRRKLPILPINAFPGPFLTVFPEFCMPFTTIFQLSSARNQLFSSQPRNSPSFGQLSSESKGFHNMLTPAKFAANQANAHHSTGPKTPEGKSASAANSLRHGLSARVLAIKAEVRPAYENLRQQIFAEIKPGNSPLLTNFVEQIIHATWNLELAQALETKALQALLDAPADINLQRTCDRFTRYRRGFESSIRAALKEIRALKSIAPAPANLIHPMVLADYIQRRQNEATAQPPPPTPNTIADEVRLP